VSEDTLYRVAETLRKIRGVDSVAALTAAHKRKVVELESLHERVLSLPVRNLGIDLIGKKEVCFALLKTAAFRAPQAPTVYMVEEAAVADQLGVERAGHAFTVAGKRYKIVGEEVTDGLEKYSEPIIPLETSFVMFPGRRSGPRVPCFFLLPPLPFPELEPVSGELGLREIISVSPSLVSDAFLREAFGFSPSNSLATLLVGFDFRSP
jgi:hypothetical protein